MDGALGVSSGGRKLAACVGGGLDDPPMEDHFFAGLVSPAEDVLVRDLMIYMRNFSFRGWQCVGASPCSERAAKLQFARRGDTITLQTDPLDTGRPGFCRTRLFSICFVGEPGSRLPGDAEALGLKVNDVLRILEERRLNKD